MPNQKFYFCDECKHVYFTLPPKNTCKICGNEIEQKDVVSEEDLLTCETCHAVYASFNWEKMIPAAELHEDHLCTCEHRCPTQSVLQINKEKGYTGNIVLAGFCQCNNCRAIFIRGIEERQKTCSVCGSKFVNPISFDPKKEKPLYVCANPSHTIRLKVKDLLINVNMQVKDSLIPILQREEQLRVEYAKHRQNIDQQKHFWKGKQQLESQLANLDKWASTQRWQIYAALKSPPMRCSAYKIDSTPNASYQKIEGCGAVADIKLKKVVESDVQQTQIKRKPEVKANNEPEKLKVEAEKVETDAVPTMNRVETPTTKAVNNISGKIAEESRTQIVRTSDEQIGIETLSNSEEFVKKLPTPKANQLFLTIQLKGIKRNNQGKELEMIPVNYGVLPIEMNSNAQTIQITREKIIQSYWVKSKMFEIQPFLFENIASIKNNNWEFSIDWKDNQLVLSQSKNHISSPTIELKTGEIISDEEKMKGIALQTVKSLAMSSFYALDKLQKGLLHKFIFEIGFIMPDQPNLNAEVY